MPGARAFLLCRTQWNYAPSGLPTGLRYSDCMAVLRAHASELGVPRSALPAVVADMQVIEAAIVEAARERADQERPRGHA